MKYAKISGTGSYLPKKILTNYDLEKLVETNHDWILERTGIIQRHIVSDDETTVSMGVEASLKALEAAQCEANDIDLVIVATLTADHTFPTAACMIQKALGIEKAGAFDVGAACAGFVYALSVADKFIRAGDCKKILVVGTEAMSRVTDWQDRATCVLFADGAGAVVLEASDEPGILSTHLHSDGGYDELLFCANPTVRSPFNPKQTSIDSPAIQMRGNEVFKLAVNTLSEVVDEALQKNKLTSEDIHWLIPHQANMRIIQATAKKLKAPIEKVVVTVHKQGNTSSASIPLALDEAVRDGRVQRGHKILMESFGGGIVWGATLIAY
ncbi:MAG: beta-ketoacyl-ACP synthase III [Pseudomonadota bacterium]